MIMNQRSYDFRSGTSVTTGVTIPVIWVNLSYNVQVTCFNSWSETSDCRCIPLANIHSTSVLDSKLLCVTYHLLLLSIHLAHHRYLFLACICEQEIMLSYWSSLWVILCCLSLLSTQNSHRPYLWSDSYIGRKSVIRLTLSIACYKQRF